MNEEEIHSKIRSAKTLEALEELRVALLGKKGYIAQKLTQITSAIPVDEKKRIGQFINKQKEAIVALLDEKSEELLSQAPLERDMTLPGTTIPPGELHLITKAIEDITDIFQQIGFYTYSFHEVEWEWFAFDALNMGKTHAARDDFETFFIDETPSKYGRMVLTPHTSSGQVREMLRRKPPIRMISISRCYRPNWDASHTPTFHQFEGLCIDEGITIANLKGTIAYFVRQFYGSQVKTRLRPYHFQFTEPSFEVDISCSVCGGTGTFEGKKCKLCKSGWLELGGAGMVHPHVLSSGGLSAKKYSGWAFGFGIERVATMRGSWLDDIRKLYGDISLYHMP